VPEAGAFPYLKRLLVGRLIPTHPVAFTTFAVLTGAILMWLSPWPVDVLIAGSVSAAWTSWLDGQEP
jgi:hypothetical protein